MYNKVVKLYIQSIQILKCRYPMMKNEMIYP